MARRRKIKERYIEFAIIITLIVIVGYSMLYLYSTTGDSKEIKLTKDGCMELGGTCRNVCESNEIKKTRCDISQSCCVAVLPSSPEDKVFLKYATDTNDLEQCNKIVNEELKSTCKLQIIDSLNINFALEYKDPSYCNLIEDVNKKNNCHIFLAKEIQDISMCSSLETNAKNRCIRDIAENKQDANFCLDIESELVRNSCIKNIALDTKKLILCNQITMKIEANDCKLKLELRELTPKYVKCINLKESECKDNMMCAPLYYTPDCDDCPARAFEICLPDNDLLCESTGGSWNILEDKCNCNNKTWYIDFGCFHCNEFKEESSITDCKNRTSS